MTFKITMPQKQQLQKRLQPVQKYVDSEILNRCNPYIPFKTGMLKKSGILDCTVCTETVLQRAVDWQAWQILGKTGNDRPRREYHARGTKKAK